MTPRPYKSAQRERSAAVTREAILRAAEDLFVSAGYQATTIADIAARADVALTTVYGSVGNKTEIVLSLIDKGKNDPVICSTLSAIRSSANASAAIATLTHGVCASMQELLPLVMVMYDTAASDPVVAESVRATEKAYRQNLVPLADFLTEREWLCTQVSREEAEDMLWFYLGLPSLRTLHLMGWSWSKIESWLTLQIVRALLPLPTSTL